MYKERRSENSQLHKITYKTHREHAQNKKRYEETKKIHCITLFDTIVRKERGTSSRW